MSQVIYKSCLAMKKEIERLQKLTGGVDNYLRDIERDIKRKVKRKKRSSKIPFPCKFCGKEELIKYGHKGGKQMYLCRDCGGKIINLTSLPRHRFSKRVYDYAIRLMRQGMSLRRVVLNIESRYGKSPTFGSVADWAKREGIKLPRRAKYERDGHRKFMIQAKRLFQENPGLDWNLAQALVSKEDEIREHINAEDERIEIERMIEAFNKIYA